MVATLVLTGSLELLAEWLSFVYQRFKPLPTSCLSCGLGAAAAAAAAAVLLVAGLIPAETGGSQTKALLIALAGGLRAAAAAVRYLPQEWLLLAA